MAGKGSLGVISVAPAWPVISHRASSHPVARGRTLHIYGTPAQNGFQGLRATGPRSPVNVTLLHLLA